MEQSGSSDNSTAGNASSPTSLVKRFVMGVKVLTDFKAYKDEIARYESELQKNARDADKTQLKKEAGERDAATS